MNYFTGRLLYGLSELPISIKECEVVKKSSLIKKWEET